MPKEGPDKIPEVAKILEVPPEKANPQAEAVKAKHEGDGLDLGESCSGEGGTCAIPSGEEDIAYERELASQQLAKEEAESASRWESVSVKEIDERAKPGNIILVGASWCKACGEAKKKIPTVNQNATLFYIDYASDPAAIDAKFKVGRNLPKIFECESPGKYKKFG